MFEQFRKEFGRASDAIPGVDASFVTMCLHILIEAFVLMKQDGRFELNWKETRFSAALIGYMDRVQRDEDLLVRIEPESSQYGQGILDGVDDPDTAPRIDIKLSGNWSSRDVYFGIEAKILVEKAWGTRRAGKLTNRYVETGIDNFVSGRYSPIVAFGCVAGYVVHGIADNIASQINARLKKLGRTSETLRDRRTIGICPDVYRSEHKRQTTDGAHIELNHVLLTFC